MSKLRISFIIVILFLIAIPAKAAPITFTDSTGRVFTLMRPPQRVVCLVPSVTEMVFRIGAGKAVVGVTYHTTYPPEAVRKPIVGGFLSPNVKRIAALHPDLIFASRLHKKVIERFAELCPVVVLEANSVSEIVAHLRIIGRIFNREAEAEQLIQKMQQEFALMAKKVARIPLKKRKRVIRLMGRDRVMTPGSDSFQTEYIRLAGGIPPDFGKRGPIVPVTLREWKRFNPQVIYGCGGDRVVVSRILSQPGWRDVEAVRNGAIHFFPCELTCRASTRAAHFVEWLSATIYGDFYAKKENQVFPDHVTSARPLALPLSYVKDARILYSRIADFPNKSLVITFKRPFKVLSTLEGPREAISTVVNHYLPPPLWKISHKMGFRRFRERVYSALGLKEKATSLLMTGADMEHLSIKVRRFRKMMVVALVTAGVRSNAVRMARDEGPYYELGPGTINIILLTNCRLTPRAMARAIISATEAKTAALQDLDVRSSYTGEIHQATGTGTDNILVVEGEGPGVDNAGGHSRLGELIAKAVYDGVQEAVFKQNGIIQTRSVFQRLEDRKISLYDLVPNRGLGPALPKGVAVVSLEALLLKREIAAFMETALAVDDQAEIGLISDLSPFRRLCLDVASRVAGRRVVALKDLVAEGDLPEAVSMAFNALLTGIALRGSQHTSEVFPGVDP